MPEPIRNRIVGHADVDPNELVANPYNHRIHPLAQAKAMDAAFAELGWLGSVKVNVVTGHVVDGHLRIVRALERDEPTVPVEYLELTPEEERKAIATFDMVGGMAVIDPAALRANVVELDLSGPLQDMVSAALGTPNMGDDTPDPDDALPDENALTWGYANFGKTKVQCSTGEVTQLTRLWEDYKESNGGSDNGFVAFLVDVENPAEAV